MKRSRQLMVPVVLSVAMIGEVGCGEQATTSPPDAARVDARAHDAMDPDAGVDALADAAPLVDAAPPADAATIDAMPDAPA